MTIEENLYEKYSKITHVSAGELYFDKNIAVDFIEQCTELGIAIIGVEFFYIKKNGIIPVIPPNGIDTSDILEENVDWKEVLKKCNSFAHSVILKEFSNNSDQYCIFITFDKAEWKKK
ncbi:hypothetical protein [Alkalibacillus haloalkaliphilus]|uniref:Immunity protein 40 domain-containing protein n=1 Tax=Alkalibacillus haloalkaliphilus TaxID=94136 RepID=A0A511W6M7_9BACI|nr:hypothetical protein [Alkalibacillus haloalkaliphilus]GEN45958.1 hypothetical protein AHA02nite_17340 [Alkalibacillus haloalkaliphilus]